MLFIKLSKVKNLTCSKFKHYMTILMLCTKIEIKKSECFTLTTKTKLNESKRNTQTRMGIHLFALLSENYIQKKDFRQQCYIYLHRIYKFHIILASK